MGRGPCSERELGLKKGAWTAEEDQKLLAFIEKNKGHGSWRTLPQLAGLQRCGKSCRLRWTNYLRPNIKRGDFSVEEERMITQLHALLGNKWSSIASHLPGRTDNEVKNHWNTHMKKRLTRMGIDPTTHRRLDSYRSQGAVHNESLLLQNNRNHTSRNPLSKPLHASRHVNVSLPDQSFVSHMAQWELARLEAEARLTATSSSSSARLRPTETISLIKPRGNVVSTTPKLDSSFAWNSSSSSRSAVGCHKYVKLPPLESQVNLRTFPAAPLISTAGAMFAAALQDENSISLPSFDTSSSASDQCAMSKPRLHAEEEELHMSSGTVGDGGNMTARSISSGSWLDAESTCNLRGATSPLLPEELLMNMSPGPSHDEVQAPPGLFELISCSPDQACAESGSAYWAHLLHHGLLMGPSSTSLSSCPC